MCRIRSTDFTQNKLNPLRCYFFARQRSVGGGRAGIEERQHLLLSVNSLRLSERLVFYCRTTSTRTAPCTCRWMCVPTHCASHCAPCQPLLRAPPVIKRIQGRNSSTKRRIQDCYGEPQLCLRPPRLVSAVHQFRGGLLFKAQRHLYHSTLGLRVTRNKNKSALN